MPRQGARLLACELLVETASQVMMVYVGHWEVFGLTLKTLKNIAKFEEPRGVLLRSTEAPPPHPFPPPNPPLCLTSSSPGRSTPSLEPMPDVCVMCIRCESGSTK